MQKKKKQYQKFKSIFLKTIFRFSEILYFYNFIIILLVVTQNFDFKFFINNLNTKISILVYINNNLVIFSYGQQNINAKQITGDLGNTQYHAELDELKETMIFQDF